MKTVSTAQLMAAMLGTTTVSLPVGAEILDVVDQFGNPALVYAGDFTQPSEPVQIISAGNGQSPAPDGAPLRYIGSWAPVGGARLFFFRQGVTLHG